MYRHMSVSIKGLLAQTDEELEYWIQYTKDENGNRPGSVGEFRKALQEELAAGNRLIRVPECDNFDPVKGCLGHEDRK